MATCAQFLHQCGLVFSQQPLTYSSDQSCVAFIMSLCTEKAAAWSLVISLNNPALCLNYSAFTDEMLCAFDHQVKGKEATSQLLSPVQGEGSVSQYALNFRILAAGSGWNESALQGVFLKGLSERIKDKLAARDKTISPEELIGLATQLDDRLRERCRERTECKRGPLQPIPPT